MAENRGQMERVFLGLKSCLLVPEQLQESESILMKTNQLLYDLMPDTMRNNDLQQEIQKLIPALI
jgi:hypothetical protein